MQPPRSTRAAETVAALPQIRKIGWIEELFLVQEACNLAAQVLWMCQSHLRSTFPSSPLQSRCGRHH